MQKRYPNDLTRRKRLRVLKILLIDNNVTDVSLFRIAFRDLRIRHKLQVVHNGKAALKILGGRSPKNWPTLIVLDAKMPGVKMQDGFGILGAIRKNVKLRVIPIIVLCSSHDECDVYRAYELGANAYMCKPQDDFVDVIGDFDRFWLRCARLPVHPGVHA